MIRTNPLLTTNMKINVDTELNLYLESFNSTRELNNEKYKHFKINETSLLENKILDFYDGLPIEIAYYVKNNDDKDIVYNKYSEQFDDIYWSGVKKIEQNKFYNEEFEYFAPLYMKYDDLPDNFIIMRVDDPGVYEVSNTDYSISETNNKNFREEIINKWKCIRNYDLSIKTKLGTWLDTNFVSNDRFPSSPFEFNSDLENSSKWFGIDYNHGSFTSSDKLVHDQLWYEQQHFKLEEYITRGYKSTGLIYPNILNMNYLFNDTPASPFQLNKYSINRYFGFYVDMTKIEVLTSHKALDIKPGLKIVNNIFMYQNATSTSTNPFFETDEEWDDDKEYYIYVKDDLFKVVKVDISNLTIDPFATEHSNVDGEIDAVATFTTGFQSGEEDNDGPFDNQYISDDVVSTLETNGGLPPEEDITYGGMVGELATNAIIGFDDGTPDQPSGPIYSYTILCEYTVKISDITRDKEVDIIFVEGDDYSYENIIKSSNDVPLQMDRIISPYGLEYLYADLYLIKIDNDFHVLEYQDVGEDKYLIRTDYGIETNEYFLSYWIENKTKKTNKLIHDSYNHEKPLTYEIYRVKFRDIKDFDFNRIDTGFANFDFDQKDKYVKTREPKLYCEELRDASESKVLKKYDLLSEVNPGEIMVSSSEYITDNSLYQLTKNGLTGVWDKNPSISKWGFVGSISHADYPYKMNNSLSAGSRYNKTTDVHDVVPNEEAKTNDFFYKIGTYISGNTEGTTFDFQYFETQAQSIETDSYGEDDEVTQFDLDVYLSGDFDYFDYFFNNKRYVNKDKDYVQTQQYSMFSNGSRYNQSVTLFKGIKFIVDNVTDVIKDDLGVTSKYLIDNSINFNQYKFSIVADYTNSGYTGTDSYEYIDNKLREYPPSGIKYEGGELGQNNISVFVNKKFKNILVVLRLESVVTGNTINIHNVACYDNGVVYNGSGRNPDIPVAKINTALSTANIFITDLNNNLINYYYVDKYGESGKTLNTESNVTNGNMEKIKSWGKIFSPIRLRSTSIKKIDIKPQSNIVAAIEGPLTNLDGEYKDDFNETFYEESFIQEPLATFVQVNEAVIKPQEQVHGETLTYEETIFRYNGPYEPIFRNVSLFEPSNFYQVNGSGFKQKKCGGNYEEITSQVSEATPWIFGEYSLDLCDDVYTYSVLEMGESDISRQTRVLSISDFKFDIPNASVIKGIKASIKRYAENGPGIDENVLYYSSISDGLIQLTVGGENKAIVSEDDFPVGFTGTAEETGYWNNYSVVVDYGGEDDLWGLSGDTLIKAEDINNSNFGLGIGVVSHKQIDYSATGTPKIDCVCIEITYTINDIEPNRIYTSKMERNVSFDTSVRDFGKIDQLIYSKINEKENMLKLRNSKEDRSIYPMIDEFGYSWDKRFIFKSSWDSDYYIKTKKDLRRL